VDALAQLSDSMIVKKFDSYNKIWHKNKILLITNQNKFLASDTIYIKCYLLNEDLSAEEENQLVTVTLVDSNGKSSCQIKFVVKSGVSSNQLILPKELASGIYMLTAHTNWMRNFGTSYFFRKEIVVVKSNKVVPVINPFLKIAVEGGHLINNVTNKVVFSCDKPGSVVQLIDSFGNQIAQDTADLNGIGAIHFVPKDDVTYQLGNASEKINIPMPRAEKNSIGLNIIHNFKRDSIQIRVVATKALVTSSSPLILIVSSGSKIIYARLHTLNANQSFQKSLALNTLPEGVYNVSLLDQNGSLIAHSDFYSAETQELNKKITLSKDLFFTTDSLSINIALKDAEGKPLKANFSVSVINKNVFDSNKNVTITDELKLFYGRDEKILVDRSTINWQESVDNYLIMNPELIPWNEILKANPSTPRYAKTNIVQRAGTAYFADGKKMLDSANIFFYSQKSKVKYQTKMLGGKVWVPLPTLYGSDELFYLAESFFYQNGVTRGLPLPNFRVRWDLDTMNLPRPVVSKELNILDDFGQFKAKINSIGKSFGFQSSATARTNVQHDFEKEINGADVVVNVEDYVVFPTMAELIKEVVPSLFHRVEKGKEIIRVILPEKMATAVSGDPVYMVDGIATNNTDFFLSIKPVDLVQIKVVNSERKLRSFGLMGKNGIVIVQTKQENRRESVDVSNLVDGLNLTAAFPSLKNNVIEIPNFRSTIDWHPIVKTDENGKASVKINLSDDIGNIEMSVNGITSNGIPFSLAQPINVKLAKRSD
jgi:hypothetical protein